MEIKNTYYIKGKTMAGKLIAEINDNLVVAEPMSWFTGECDTGRQIVLDLREFNGEGNYLYNDKDMFNIDVSRLRKNDSGHETRVALMGVIKDAENKCPPEILEKLKLLLRNLYSNKGE